LCVCLYDVVWLCKGVIMPHLKPPVFVSYAGLILTFVSLPAFVCAAHRGVIMFCHMYFCLCAAVAAAFTLYLHSDPLR
jgi:hypothetical protein